MHGLPNLKIFIAKQAKQIFHYKKIKIKLYNLILCNLYTKLCIKLVSIREFIFIYKIILWDHRRICCLSLTETSLCGAYLYMISRFAPLKRGSSLSSAKESQL